MISMLRIEGATIVEADAHDVEVTDYVEWNKNNMRYEQRPKKMETHYTRIIIKDDKGDTYELRPTGDGYGATWIEVD